MKKYIRPEATAYQVNTSEVICTSGNADRTGIGSGYGPGGGGAPAAERRNGWDDYENN